MMARRFDTQADTRYLRWLMRISDDMWGAAQLLGLFFLGATILCVPPHTYTSAAAGAQSKAASAGSAGEVRPAATATPAILFTASSVRLTPLPASDKLASSNVTPVPAAASSR